MINNQATNGAPVAHRQYLTAAEVTEVLPISESQAYTVISRLNSELKAKGFMTARGKIPAKYLCERYGLDLAPGSATTSKPFYNVEDMRAIFKVSEAEGYRFIQALNAELAGLGYLTVRGKVPAKYVRTRYYL